MLNLISVIVYKDIKLVDRILFVTPKRGFKRSRFSELDFTSILTIPDMSPDSVTQTHQIN